MKFKYLTSVLLIFLILESANVFPYENNSHCNLLAISRHDTVKANNARSDRDGGIGGTGIFAEITSINPLKIAGCKVARDEMIKVIDDFAELKVKDLRVGQFVYMTADLKDNELFTKNIVLQHLIEGPITKIISKNRIEVMGQIVELTEHSTHFHINSKELVRHDYVKVSGLRLSNGAITATRVDVVKPIALAGVTGKLTVINSKYFIGGIAIAGKLDGNLVGNKILAIGKWNGSELEVVKSKQMDINSQSSTSLIVISGVVTANDGQTIHLIDDHRIYKAKPSSQALLRFDKDTIVMILGETKPNKDVELLDIWRIKM